MCLRDLDVENEVTSLNLQDVHVAESTKRDMPSSVAMQIWPAIGLESSETVVSYLNSAFPWERTANVTLSDIDTSADSGTAKSPIGPHFVNKQTFQTPHQFPRSHPESTFWTCIGSPSEGVRKVGLRSAIASSTSDSSSVASKRW